MNKAWFRVLNVLAWGLVGKWDGGCTRSQCAFARFCPPKQSPSHIFRQIASTSPNLLQLASSSSMPQAVLPRCSPNSKIRELQAPCTLSSFEVD